jgi:hypothetical protein
MKRLLLVVVIAAACGNKSGGVAGSGGGSGTAVVSYQPTVKVIERDAGLAAIVGASHDGWTLLLDGSKLAPKVGDILIIKGLMARKVLAVEQEPDNKIAVLTQSPTLGEALQQGKIDLDAKVRFSQRGAWLEAPRERSWTDMFEGTAEAGGPSVSIESNTVKASYEGWDAELTTEMAGGRVNLDIKLTKSVAGFKATVTGKGYIEDFDVSSNVEVNAGTVSHVRMMIKHMNGRMDFTWEVGKDSPGGEYGKGYIKLPGALEIPLAEFLDGFPLFLEVSAAILIEPGITGGKEVAKGAFHVTYNGNDGFDYKGGAVDQGDAQMEGDSEVDDAQAVSAAAPIGMVVAFAAPRLELTFGLAKVLSKDVKDTVQKAAEEVDKIGDKLIKGLFGDDGLAKWKASPMGGFSLSQAADAALKSDATAWLEIETSTGMTASGAMAIVPCRKTNLNIAGTAGVGAQVLGVKVGTASTTLFKKEMVKVEPPNLKACQ